MREKSTSTTWRCDGNPGDASCLTTEILTDGYQDVPPKGWRLIRIMSTNLNLALEGDTVKQLSLCKNCFNEKFGYLT